jgi:peroxiredoxin
MALLSTPAGDLGSVLPEFSLPATDGTTVHASGLKDARAVLVIFMCNHCPYVIAVQDRINALAKKYQAMNVRVVGISSNDPNYKNDDSFENMKIRAKELGYVFPYLFDESQEVAKTFGAVCTPDPFLFASQGGDQRLVYRGRIDDSWKDASAVKHRDLEAAIDAVLAGQAVSQEQIPSMGCSIKWKA